MLIVNFFFLILESSVSQSISSLAQQILNLKNPSIEAQKQFDDDTDIYPETDDEFYCVAWRK